MKGVTLVNASELKGLFFINITNYIGKLLLRHLLTSKCKSISDKTAAGMLKSPQPLFIIIFQIFF